MKFEPVSQCTHCPFGKQTQAPFKGTENMQKEIGNTIASDLCGPFESSIGGYKYFVTWIDIKSRHASVDFLKNKECATMSDSFKWYLAWITRQKHVSIKRIQTDNGGEYLRREFQYIFAQEGIIHETTSPYTPEHNGIAKHYNRTLQEGTLTIQHDANLSNRFWVSAIHTVNFIRNHIIHSRLNTSPYEAFWGSKPKIDWLRTYGSKCWALIPKVSQQKGTYKSVEGIFVGYFDDSKAYKIWILRTQTVLKARDVIFDESNHIERVTIHSTDEDNLLDLWNNTIPISMSEATTPPAESPQEGENTPTTQTVTHEPQTTHIKQTEDDTTGTVRYEPKPIEGKSQTGSKDGVNDGKDNNNIYAPSIAPEDFEHRPWLDPNDETYGRGQRRQAIATELIALANGENNLESIKTALVTLAEDEPENYREAM